MLDNVQTTTDAVLENDPACGAYRIAHDIFSDPVLFELEVVQLKFLRSIEPGLLTGLAFRLLSACARIR